MADEPARKSASLVRLWAPLCVGAALAIVSLYVLRPFLTIDAETAAMGATTQALYGHGPDGRIHCAGAADWAACGEAYGKAGRPPAALWLGNSQLHGINRYRAGEATAPEILHKILREKGLYLATFSLPNANLTEHQAIFRALGGRYDTRLVILAVCLDDFREVGVRDRLLNAGADGARDASTEDAPAAGHKSLQPIVEEALSAAVGRGWPLWADRPNMQSGLRYAAFALRNKAFGISAQTKRSIPGQIYGARMAELETFVSGLTGAGKQVLIYVPPYRSDIRGPYVAAQYDQFRTDLNALARRHGARYADLTTIVPGPEWGMIRDDVFGFEDYDFMHFTAEGHRRLAAAVAGAL